MSKSRIALVARSSSLRGSSSSASAATTCGKAAGSSGRGGRCSRRFGAGVPPGVALDPRPQQALARHRRTAAQLLDRPRQDSPGRRWTPRRSRSSRSRIDQLSDPRHYTDAGARPRRTSGERSTTPAGRRRSTTSRCPRCWRAWNWPPRTSTNSCRSTSPVRTCSRIQRPQDGPQGDRLVQDRPERLLGRLDALESDPGRRPLGRVALWSRHAPRQAAGQHPALVPHGVRAPPRPLPHRDEQRAAQGRREALPRDHGAARRTAAWTTPAAEATDSAAACRAPRSSRSRSPCSAR